MRVMELIEGQRSGVVEKAVPPSQDTANYRRPVLGLANPQAIAAATNQAGSIMGSGGSRGIADGDDPGNRDVPGSSGSGSTTDSGGRRRQRGGLATGAPSAPPPRRSSKSKKKSSKAYKPVTARGETRKEHKPYIVSGKLAPSKLILKRNRTVSRTFTRSSRLTWRRPSGTATRPIQMLPLLLITPAAPPERDLSYWTSKCVGTC